MEETLNSGVYLIRNVYTKDAYVGSAHDFTKRWRLHRINLDARRHHSRILQNAWNKYGAGAFEWVVLERCPKNDVLAAEQVWLDQLTAKYNVCRVAGSRAGTKNTDAQNARISEKAKARWADPAFKAKISLAAKQNAVRGARTQLHGTERMITFLGETKTLSAWSSSTGVKRETIAYRLNAGHPVEIALSTAKLPKGPKKCPQ
jgi:group I intron endonuclease